MLISGNPFAITLVLVLVRAGPSSERSQRVGEVDLLQVLRTRPPVAMVLARSYQALQRSERLERVVCGRTGKRQAGSHEDYPPVCALAAGGDKRPGSRVEADCRGDLTTVPR